MAQSGDKIVLNIGGIRYETNRSTLTAYPETFLGTMFNERNAALLHPTKEGEYFIDRDGTAFKYIMQYYRDGKISWRDFCDRDYNQHIPQITRRELEKELDYYQIPKSVLNVPPSVVVSEQVDEFIAILKDVIYDLIRHMRNEWTLEFYKNVNGSSTTHSMKLHSLSTVRRHAEFFDLAGYEIFDMFGEEIRRHLEKEIPNLCCTITREDFNHLPKYRFHITIDNKLSRATILSETCLSEYF
ncbi:7101_t:CDS:2 [Ambispora gerdemannii]|uniref:7101_t:CDS:1 n=1 Tax=Ambispora gerdemannii TaxID=144530 RepID=A0A9N9A6Z7_9GLOM|nr:7101_t:CDS:2 [Ambispora gerdemannii]